MLINIGQGRREDGDLVDLLLECHERIRRFVALARSAGERAELPDDEVVDACSRVERYFIEALPLHVADEEDSILPRLRGYSDEVDRGLRSMHDQHTEHEPKLSALLSASSAVREDPRDPPRRATLAAAAEELAREFDAHLTLEETVIFPAIRALPAAAQAEIVEELRARRHR